MSLLAFTWEEGANAQLHATKGQTKGYFPRCSQRMAMALVGHLVDAFGPILFVPERSSNRCNELGRDRNSWPGSVQFNALHKEDNDIE